MEYIGSLNKTTRFLNLAIWSVNVNLIEKYTQTGIVWTIAVEINAIFVIKIWVLQLIY